MKIYKILLNICFDKSLNMYQRIKKSCRYLLYLDKLIININKTLFLI